MGIYAEYLDKRMSMGDLQAERKVQLNRIAALRERAVLCYGANVMNGKQPVQINYSDILPFSEQVSGLTGTAVDVILETPGGSGETVEDLVKILRQKFDSVGVIVPGTAKSAGTIFAMAADEILMEPASSLGPIDAQMMAQGKVFSAHALLEGMDKIKKEVEATRSLNKAYVPMLQSLSPGELQNAQNAYDFARDLVTDQLTNYKFKNWVTHSSTGLPVTPEERAERARSIAEKLRDQNRWKTHGRSIKMEDLRAMRLLITDYTETPELCDAIRRYHILLRMTFDSSIFKVFETPTSQILQAEQIQQIAPGGMTPAHVQAALRAAKSAPALLEVRCSKCSLPIKIHANIGVPVPAPAGTLGFPKNNKLNCPSCGQEHDLTEPRRQLELQAGRSLSF